MRRPLVIGLLLIALLQGCARWDAVSGGQSEPHLITMYPGVWRLSLPASEAVMDGRHGDTASPLPAA
jgi:hypothetical protein